MVFSDRDKLLNICHALGGRARCDDPTLGSAQTPYIPGDEVLECLKDLRKILKLDLATTDKPSFKTLGEWDVLRLDLLPILCVSDSVKVKIAVVELLVPMTWPINENSPDVPAEVELLTRYKEAFLENNAFAVIGKLLLSFVAIPLRNRTERDSAKIRIILLLFRNLLAMRDPLATSTASTEDFLRMNLSEHIIAKMHAAGILDVLLTFAASLDQREFNDWNMIILEIFHLLFRDRDPASISADQNNEANVKEKLATFDSQIRKPTSTRHSRFGGALKVHLPDGTKVNVFGTKNIINFGVGRALDSSKMGRNLVREQKPEVDPGIRRLQSKEARQVLHRLAVSFTKEGFNTFVRSVKRDFDIERGTVQEVNYFQFIQTVSFVLRFFQSVRSDEINLDRVISFMDQRGLLFLLKRLRIYQEEKKWTEVQVTLDCLKNFLLILNMMMQSSDEEIRDLGENVLRNIFYEEWIVESLVALCRTYKSQSIRYLEVLVETTHILLKTLQSYSKEKSFVVGRKKRQAKKAKKVQTQTPDEEPGLREDDSSDENEKPVETTVEREFRFEKIEMDFAYESVVRTYCDLLSRFETIEPKYVHYITVMLHRICVKSKMESLCYKVSTLDLFARILDSTHFLRTPEGKELQAFANHIVRRLSGALESYPMLLIDALFPKTRSDCVRIQNFSWDETEETKKEPLAISDLGEIEVKPSLTWSEQVGVAVSILIQDNKRALVDWVTTCMTAIAAKRSLTDTEDIEPVDLTERAPNDVLLELKICNAFRMLLRLVKAEEHEDTDAWIVPRTKSADDLLSDCKIIQDFIEKPFDDDGKPLSKFLKKRSKKRRTKRKESDGPPAKRVKSSGAIQSSLSKQFVDSSDEDDDEEFFEKERQLRAKVAAAAAATAKMPIHALAAATASRPVKEQKVAGRRVNAKRHNLEALVSDSDDDDSRSETIIPTPRRRAPINVFESDSEVEDGNQGSDDQGKASQPTTSPAAIDSGFADEGNSSGDGGVGADKMGRPEVNGYMGSTHSRSLSVFSDSE